MILAVDGKDYPPCEGCVAAISNPNPVEVTLPSGESRIILVFDTMNNPNRTQHGSDMYAYSDDDGETWTVHDVPISYPPHDNNGTLVGPTAGLRSPRTGFIYFAAHFLFWSEDNGETWKASNSTPPHVNECSLAFVPPNNETSLIDDENEAETILMNCRTSDEHRANVFWNAKNGKLLTDKTYPEGLVDPNCQGSIVTDYDSSSIFLSNAASAHERMKMTVKRSRDGGVTWDDGVQIHWGPSAYSQLTVLNDGQQERSEVQLGLIFEGGVFSTYEQITYTNVSRAL